MPQFLCNHLCRIVTKVGATRETLTSICKNCQLWKLMFFGFSLVLFPDGEARTALLEALGVLCVYDIGCERSVGLLEGRRRPSSSFCGVVHLLLWANAQCLRQECFSVCQGTNILSCELMHLLWKYRWIYMVRVIYEVKNAVRFELGSWNVLLGDLPSFFLGSRRHSLSKPRPSLNSFYRMLRIPGVLSLRIQFILSARMR